MSFSLSFTQEWTVDFSRKHLACDNVIALKANQTYACLFLCFLNFVRLSFLIRSIVIVQEILRLGEEFPLFDLNKSVRVQGLSIKNLKKQRSDSSPLFQVNE